LLFGSIYQLPAAIGIEASWKLNGIPIDPKSGRSGDTILLVRLNEIQDVAKKFVLANCLNPDIAGLRFKEINSE